MKLNTARFICAWALRRGVQDGALLQLEIEIKQSSRAFYETGG